MADDISQWLENLGLGQYAPMFAENAVELDHLPYLTEDDLRELDIPLGPRRKLQAAIKSLEPPAQIAVNAQHDPELRSGDAELRQLTVLFCDLVGSTALSAKLDPEDMREIIRAYQDACAEVVARYEGFVAKYMGDGVLVYFGYPQSFENDAERAIHAGLELVEAVAALRAPNEEALAARIGIATGGVIVGDIVGKGASREAAITGETPNLAARLQDAALPGSVVIGEMTHMLAGALFETESLPLLTLKGFADPMSAWTVARPQRSESRFQATHGASLTELVGREEEMAILRRRWDQAVSGEGRVVLISGEPGIGKSRLVHEIRAHVAAAGGYTRAWQCSPHHAASALFPFVEQAAIAIGVTPRDSNEEMLDKLEAWIRISGQKPEDIAPIFAPFLSIDATMRYLTPTASPQRQKEILFDGFAKRFDGLAAKSPFLLITEDAHWIDPTSLELVNMHIEQARTAGCMIIVTYRPEFDAPWVGEAHTSLMALNRLDGARCAELAVKVGGGASLSMEIVDQIVERTDGVPLFVEELTTAIIESGATDNGGEKIDARTMAIPATLQDALEARLDRLGEAREIAQIGAVIGRSFGYGLLAQVADIDETELHGILEDLTASELVFRGGEPPDATYTFKHALIQDTAYNSLLRDRRAEFHARVTRVLESEFSDQVETAPEILAHHYTEAGDTEQGVDWWTRAGRAAAERFANNEAIDQLNRALVMLTETTDMADRSRRELDVQSALAPTLLAMHGFGSEEPRQAFQRVRELSAENDNTDALFRALWGLWLSNAGSSRADRASLVSELLEIAEQNENSVYRLQAQHAAWGGPFETRHEIDLEHIERGLAVYDATLHVPTARLFGGHDAGVCGLMHAALTLWQLGRPEQAMKKCRQGLELAEDISHYPPARTQAEAWCAILHLFAQDWPQTRHFAESAIRVGRDCGALPFVYIALPLYGMALVKLGEVGAGLKAIDERLEVFGGHEIPNGGGFSLALKAEACGIAGMTEKALALLDESLVLSERYHAAAWVPNIHRIKGEILLTLSEDGQPEAEACFRAAIESALRQDAKMWELRASNSLARLWQSQDKTAEARHLLAPVYNWFTEGFDTADFKDAKALLDALQ